MIPPKPKPKPPQPSAPWRTPETDDPDIFALQAIARGIASEGQQQRAWAYIVATLCATDRMSFYPGGEDGRRASDFAEGKRWIGLQLRRIERMRPDHGRESKES